MGIIDELIVRIRADTRQLQRELKKAGHVTEAETTKMRRSFDGVRASIVALASVAVARQVIRYADSWSQLQSRLRLVTSETGNLAEVSEKLFKIAQDTRADLGATVTLYQRLTFATRGLGITQDEVLTFTEQLNKQLLVGGLSATEAATSIFQLTQAFNKGKLDGDEFRTILESAPPILEALQVSLGKTKGEILEMSAAGKLGPRQLIDAVNDMAETTDRRFGEIPLTVNSALQKLENSFEKFIGDDSLVANYVQNLAYGLEGISIIIDDIGRGMDYLGREISGENEYIRRAREGGFVTEPTMLPPNQPGTEIDKALREAGLPGIRPVPKKSQQRTDEPARQKRRQSVRDTRELSEETEQLVRRMEDARKVFEETRTPLEEYNMELARVRKLYDEGLLSQDTFIRKTRQLNEEYLESTDRMKDATIETVRVMKDHFGDALEDLMFDFENFGDNVSNVFEGMARDLARQQIIDPFTQAVGSSISGSLGGGNLFDSVFGGFFADGGRPPVGRASIVGERGPEMFIPDTKGTIVPNHAMGGVNVTNVFNISPGVQGTVQAEVMRMAPVIAAQAKAGVFAAIERGGREASLVGRKT